MRDTFRVITRMVADGIIGNYAVTGAVAALNRVRTLRAEHVVANALSVDRPKDRVRIGQFLADDAVDLVALREVLDRHAMREIWANLCARTGIADPYGAESRS